MSTLESSGPNIKFSEEFRQTVYKINPDYLSCTHKALFEVNATDNLRNQESDFQIVTNNSSERRKPFSDVNEINAPSRSSSSITGTFSDSALKVLQNNCLSVDRRVRLLLHVYYSLAFFLSNTLKPTSFSSKSCVY